MQEFWFQWGNTNNFYVYVLSKTVILLHITNTVQNRNVKSENKNQVYVKCHMKYVILPAKQYKPYIYINIFIDLPFKKKILNDLG